MSLHETKIVSVKVVGHLVDIGKEASKAMPPGSRYRYSKKLLYVDENGRQAFGMAKGISKPKLAADIERKERYVREGSLFASYMDGEFTGTIVKVSLMMR